MKVLLACICLISIASAEESVLRPKRDTLQCSNGYTYSTEMNKCYRRSTYYDTWQGAVARCRRDGASLLVLETNKEVNYIKNRDGNFPEELFLGVNDMVNEGVFMTIHGETLEQQEFRELPSYESDRNKENRDCLGLSTDFNLKVFDCGSQLKFYCEKSADNENE